MTLPENFTPIEHLKDVLRKTFNALVRDEFKDLDVDDLELDIAIPRQSLKTACLIRPEDSQIAINNRMMLFYFIMRKAQDLQEPVYGMPTGTFHELRRFKPTVTLYFKEDPEDVDPDYHPIRVQLSFRLMDDSPSKTELTTLANKVKTEFGAGNGYRFHRGKTLCSYYDPEKGYKLKVFAYSAVEGKEVIGKVLDLQNHTPDWDKLTINENDSPSTAYPIIPPTETILGKVTRLPRKRPVGYVRFQRATCAIWGLTKPVALYDRTGRLLATLADET
jgi:hypothetical protein